MKGITNKTWHINRTLWALACTNQIARVKVDNKPEESMFVLYDPEFVFDESIDRPLETDCNPVIQFTNVGPNNDFVNTVTCKLMHVIDVESPTFDQADKVWTITVDSTKGW